MPPDTPLDPSAPERPAQGTEVLLADPEPPQDPRAPGPDDVREITQDSTASNPDSGADLPIMAKPRLFAEQGFVPDAVAFDLPDSAQAEDLPLVPAADPIQTLPAWIKDLVK